MSAFCDLHIRASSRPVLTKTDRAAVADEGFRIASGGLPGVETLFARPAATER